MVTLTKNSSASMALFFPLSLKRLARQDELRNRNMGRPSVIGIRESLPLVEWRQILQNGILSVIKKDGKQLDRSKVTASAIPTFVVDNDPGKEFKAKPAARSAIQEMQEELKDQTVRLPPVQPYPDRNRRKGSEVRDRTDCDATRHQLTTNPADR